MQNSYYKSLVYFSYCLILFSFYCSLTIGLGLDENYHHINGALRYLYLEKLGNFNEYNWKNNRYYPGLYDTIHYVLYKLLNLFVDIKHIVKIKHTVNFLFSSLGVLGLFYVNRKLFNKEVGIISCILTLLNPIFFGHMGMNPKDPIIFFAIIWTVYFFILYLENLENHRLKYLLLMSIFIGFGTGIRLTFAVLIIPLAAIWIFALLKKKIKISSIAIDLFYGLIVIFFLTFLTWPHIHTGNYDLILDVIKKSSSWLIPFKHGIVNGNFYEIQNTPRTYIINIFLNKMPVYFSILILFSYLIVFLKKTFFIEKINSNFFIYFFLINLVLFFPIITMIITKTNLYDNIRLFLFVIPFFATLASIGLFFIIINFKEINLIYKSFSLGVVILILLSFYRFTLLTPYQYVYVNYFSSPIFHKSFNKFEHDYWYTSYGELINKIKKKYGDVEASKLKIRTCDSFMVGHRYYFNQVLKNQQSLPENADYVILTNRNLRLRKMNCFQLFNGEDILKVERLGMTLSAFKKIQPKQEEKEYMTSEWLKNSKK